MILRVLTALILSNSLIAEEPRERKPTATGIHQETQKRLNNTSLYFRGARIYDQMCNC